MTTKQELPTLSIAGAATYMGLTERHVRALVQERRVRSYRVGRLVRLAQADLDACMLSCPVERWVRGRS